MLDPVKLNGNYEHGRMQFFSLARVGCQTVSGLDLEERNGFHLLEQGVELPLCNCPMYRATFSYIANTHVLQTAVTLGQNGVLWARCFTALTVEKQLKSGETIYTRWQ